MNLVDQLSDTTYRDKASQILDDFVSEHGCSVNRSQIYGLRQIAIQQPLKAKAFADHQRQRAERKHVTASPSMKSKLEHEIAFWKMVANLCGGEASSWSLSAMACEFLPAELREENIPEKRSGMTQEDRGRRNRLIKQQRDWIESWSNEHFPAFFRRFCTHYLYQRGLRENSSRE